MNEVRITANGYRPDDGLALEVKYVGLPASSPFVPGSQVPDFIRRAVLEDLDSEQRVSPDVGSERLRRLVSP